jgi:alkyl hydroperoxide reductase subunit AhpF
VPLLAFEGAEQMPSTEKYDVLVIGSGEAGKYLA